MVEGHCSVCVFVHLCAGPTLEYLLPSTYWPCLFFFFLNLITPVIAPGPPLFFYDSSL